MAVFKVRGFKLWKILISLISFISTPMYMLLFANNTWITVNAWAPALPTMMLRPGIWYLWGSAVKGHRLASAALGFLLSHGMMACTATSVAIAAVPALPL